MRVYKLKSVICTDSNLLQTYPCLAPLTYRDSNGEVCIKRVSIEEIHAISLLTGKILLFDAKNAEVTIYDDYIE